MRICLSSKRREGEREREILWPYGFLCVCVCLQVKETTSVFVGGKRGKKYRQWHGVGGPVCGKVSEYVDHKRRKKTKRELCVWAVWKRVQTDRHTHAHTERRRWSSAESSREECDTRAFSAVSNPAKIHPPLLCKSTPQDTLLVLDRFKNKRTKKKASEREQQIIKERGGVTR